MISNWYSEVNWNEWKSYKRSGYDSNLWYRNEYVKTSFDSYDLKCELLSLYMCYSFWVFIEIFWFVFLAINYLKTSLFFQFDWLLTIVFNELEITRTHSCELSKLFIIKHSDFRKDKWNFLWWSPLPNKLVSQFVCAAHPLV